MTTVLNNLLLNSGNPIPFVGAMTTIYPPTVRQIAFYGEQIFYNGCMLLTFSKETVGNVGNLGENEVSDFEVIMSVMRDENPEVKRNAVAALAVLNLIFPNCSIKVSDQGFVLTDTEKNKVSFVSEMNFEEFKDILQQIFCLDFATDEVEYNPAGRKAKEIANKLRAGKAKRQQLTNPKGDKPIRILDKYVSILSVGEGKNINDLLDLTVYQLTQEFKTYQAKVAWDAYVDSIRAGASNPEKVPYWMDFGEESQNNDTYV